MASSSKASTRPPRPSSASAISIVAPSAATSNPDSPRDAYGTQLRCGLRASHRRRDAACANPSPGEAANAARRGGIDRSPRCVRISTPRVRTANHERVSRSPRACIRVIDKNKGPAIMKQATALKRDPDSTIEQVPEHYVEPHTSLVERALRTLKFGDAFAVLDSYGDVGVVPDSPEGLFMRDTRYLSRFDLRFEGKRPHLLGSVVEDDNASLAVDLTNPDIHSGDDLTIPRDIIAIERTKLLFRGACYERIAFSNFDGRARSFHVTIGFEADFPRPLRGSRLTTSRAGDVARPGARQEPRRAALRGPGQDRPPHSADLRSRPERARSKPRELRPASAARRNHRPLRDRGLRGGTGAQKRCPSPPRSKRPAAIFSPSPKAS